LVRRVCVLHDVGKRRYRSLCVLLGQLANVSGDLVARAFAAPASTLAG
jgi:hypothetical protein